MGMVGILPLMTSLFVCLWIPSAHSARPQGKEGKIQKEDFVKRGSLALELPGLGFWGGDFVEHVQWKKLIKVDIGLVENREIKF